MTRTRLVALALCGVVLSACTSIDVTVEQNSATSTSSGASTGTGGSSSQTSASPLEAPKAPADLTAAQSNPVEDSYYPDKGEPYLDTLHYGLALDWQPSLKKLAGRASITFRVTEDRSQVQFDLSSALTVSATTLDGRKVESTRGKDTLVVQTGALAKNSRHVLVVDYTGTPQTTSAPSKRSDQTGGLGFTIEDDGAAWTMQEPFGAFTWYPVNDQPADKAYYDATLTSREGQVGVFNGAPGAAKTDGDRTVRSFTLDQPAASYLTTVAFGKYELTTDKGPRDLPIHNWTRPDAVESTTIDEGLKKSPKILEYLETLLGPYPFASAGSLMVPSDSAMETQTLNTMGEDTAWDANSFAATLAHEFAHQWVGDVVSPVDWRDVWLNESLAMFVQTKYEDHAGITPYAVSMSGYRAMDSSLRKEAGPPGKYDKQHFAASNIYICGAVMYDEMQKAYGPKFYEALKTWPTVKKYGNVTRDDLIKHFSDKIGVDLKPWITLWLESETTPTQAPPPLA